MYNTGLRHTLRPPPRTGSPRCCSCCRPPRSPQCWRCRWTCQPTGWSRNSCLNSSENAHGKNSWLQKFLPIPNMMALELVYSCHSQTRVFATELILTLLSLSSASRTLPSKFFINLTWLWENFFFCLLLILALLSKSILRGSPSLLVS